MYFANYLSKNLRENGYDLQKVILIVVHYLDVNRKFVKECCRTIEQKNVCGVGKHPWKTDVCFYILPYYSLSKVKGPNASNHSPIQRNEKSRESGFLNSKNRNTRTEKPTSTEHRLKNTMGAATKNRDRVNR